MLIFNYYFKQSSKVTFKNNIKEIIGVNVA